MGVVMLFSGIVWILLTVSFQGRNTHELHKFEASGLNVGLGSDSHDGHSRTRQCAATRRLASAPPRPRAESTGSRATATTAAPSARAATAPAAASTVGTAAAYTASPTATMAAATAGRT